MKRGLPVAWYAPTYKTLEEVWQTLRGYFYGLASRMNEQMHRIEMPNDSILEMWSLEDPNASAGRKYARIVVDEAAKVPKLKYAWEHVLSNRLLDYYGDAFFPSTPKGLNYFYALYQKGMNGESDWKSFRYPTSSNPFIDKLEIEKQRASLPARVFSQEYLGEFLTDGSGVFRNTRALSVYAPEEPQDNHAYVIGRDWGRTNDPSVSSVWDIQARREVLLEIEQDTPFALQLSRLSALSERYNDALVIAEQNALGDPLIEQAALAGIRIMAFVTTNATKAVAVDNFVLACERQDIGLQSSEDGITQMEGFESSRTPMGLVKYAAPEGQHDDIVMARLFAYSAISESGPVILNSE